MAAKIDITGKKFTRLTAIARNGFDQAPSRKHIRWDCICDCGSIVNVRLNSLTTGHAKSCGCLKKEGNSNRTHGMTNTDEYRTWARLKSRCKNISSKDYHLYGGRGISICDRWFKSFENFYEDMGDKPSKNMSIDRIDVNGDYSKENCRWATNEVQSRNKRNNRFFCHEGQNLCLTDWAKKLGITPASLVERLEKWTLEKSLTKLKKGN